MQVNIPADDSRLEDIPVHISVHDVTVIRSRRFALSFHATAHTRREMKVLRLTALWGHPDPAR